MVRVRLGPWILALLVLVPIAEIAVLIAVGRQIGAWWTILLMLGTSVLGGWLLRHQGLRAWRAFQADVEARRPPGRAAIDGVLVVLGGMFMLVPGFVSDVIGLLLILPPTRALFRGLLQDALIRRTSPMAGAGMFGPNRVRARTGRSTTVDGETTTGEPVPPTQPGTSPYPGPTQYPGRSGTAAVEGEIIDPR